MGMIALAATVLALAALPALLFRANLCAYQPPPAFDPNAVAELPAVSVLIPARNEERGIVAAVEAALASKGVAVEVVVLDDHSEDGTARLVSELARRDARVRLLAAPPLPPGWCGKQHACSVLAGVARHPLLAFLDADVRLAPEGLARLATFREISGADLVSGVPYQETATFLERLVLPLIHFILLGFLPLERMRRSTHPAYAAGCGQLFLARRRAYESAGGHAALRASLHDGLQLPRAFRRAGLGTDLCDATELARCRMYRGAAEVWRGLAKNATEGLARPRLIVPATVLLMGGQVVPVLLLPFVGWMAWPARVLVLLAVALLFSPRLLGMRRFRQGLLGVILHPLGVTVLLAIQWYALGRALVGRPAFWKGRPYPAQAG